MTAAPSVPAWRHQAAGREFAHRLYGSGQRALMLAMFMGTGKTRLAIDLINDIEAPFPLIVCPVRVVEIWRAQFEKYSAAHYEFAALDDRFSSVRDKWAHARDMRAWAIARQQKLVIAINYESARMEPFASWALKVPWPVVVADECVPPGSLIATPFGDTPIEELRVGDVVMGYDHKAQATVETRVTATFQRQTDSPFVAIHKARLTPEHPVWISGAGYIPAGSVTDSNEVLTYDHKTKSLGLPKSLRTLRSDLPSGVEASTVLQQEMRQQPPGTAPADGDDDARVAPASRYCRESSEVSHRRQSVSTARDSSEGADNAQANGLSNAQGRVEGANGAPEATGLATGMAHGMAYPQPGSATPLSDRCRESAIEDCHRSRRAEPLQAKSKRTGPQENGISRRTGLDSTALLESRNPEKPQPNSEFHPVHNLETETSNYFVNGLLVHNCHRVKDGSGRTSRWLAKLGRCARYRLGLTGTPMPHSPLDIWGQFRFLDPSILDPTFGSFKQRHAVMGGYKNKEIVGWRDLDMLYADFRKIAYQVDESALELPDAIDETLECDFSGDGRRVYAEMENEMVAWIRDMDGKGVEVTAANAMVRLTRLQQITGGSLPDDQGRPALVDMGKEALLSDFLADIGDEPVVVFAVYKPDLAAIRRAAEANGLKWGEVSGARDDLEEWKRGGSSVLATQIQSGGEGIDLTRARIAVYYSHGFSLAQYKQSRSRIWRPPQTRPCAFYHLQVRHSIDQYVLRAVLARQDLVESVLKGLRRS